MPRHISRRLPVSTQSKRRLADSQNFLTDHALTAELTTLAECSRGGLIVEIGPGRGILTEKLSAQTSRVLAVEADPRFTKKLIKRFADNPRVTIAHGDFLEYPLPAEAFTVVANIPFNRTSEIIRKLTGEKSGMKAAYLVLQAEAADKLCPTPGRPAQLSALFLQLGFTVRELKRINRRCFTPRPGVDAVYISIKRRGVPLLAGDDDELFRDLLSFLYPRGPGIREALGRVFSAVQLRLILSDLELQGNRRIGDLSLAQWLEVYDVFSHQARQEALRKVKGAYRKLQKEQAGLEKRHRRPR